MPSASTAVVASLSVGAIAHGALRVTRVRAREAMDTGYEAEVAVELDGVDVDPTAWIFEGAEIVLARADDGAIVRRLAGVVTRVRELAAVEAGRARVTIEIASPLAALALVVDHRLFQGQTTVEIARTLLAEAGAPRVDVRLAGAHPAREVATQHGETSAAFLARLLEEDAISTWFEHDEQGATFVLADHAGAMRAAGAVRVAHAEGLVGGAAATSVTEAVRARPARVTLRDHDFRHPALDLGVSAADDAPLGRELYEAPARHRDLAEGDRRARAILAGLAADASTIRLAGSLGAIAPGHRFTLEGAPDAALDREWIVRRRTTAWDEAHDGAPVASEVVAVRADAPIAPLRVTPRPAAPGPSLARVRGPRGAEIHCDEHGRVKVAFAWDRRATGDDRSSAWVRVGQAAMGGAIAVPRVGWEVLVAFEDGDPDAPVVLGRLYNGAFPPPYALPASRATSALGSYSSPGSDGKNELRFSDGAGGEQVAVHAQKDMTVDVAANRRETVGGGESRVVAASQRTTIGGSRSVALGAAAETAITGAASLAVGGARDESVGGDAKADVKGARSLVVGGTHSLTTPMSASTTTAGALAEVVGGSVVEAAGAGTSTAVAGAASFAIGGAKIELAGAGKTETTVGAHATTVGGAAIAVAGGDLSVGSGGPKATTIGGAWVATAGGDLELAAASSLSITVGGAIALTAGSITLAVGGSKVTFAGGAVSISSPSVRIAATGPHVETGPMIEDN